MDCACPGPGFCPRYGIEQQQYPWEVCQGKRGEAIQLRYQAKWARRAGQTPPPPPPPPRPVPAPGGPGTDLRAALKAAGIDLAGCSCNNRVRVMDQMGLDWCRASRAQIVGWLESTARERDWPAADFAGIVDGVLGA